MGRTTRGKQKARTTGRRPKRPTSPPLSLRALVGMFASGAGDLSRHHDEDLYGWKKPDA